ncbi:hypothetical protein GB992_02635 [Lactobacillus rossiae]|uniref:Uncharacterized protein n=1 Tax=Furfurilactobacillus rossiae TaxID=231049 RepID=A0A7C9IYV1_9LACO|nr:hypothetical protein [Furfurilactobacillus milii]
MTIKTMQMTLSSRTPKTNKLFENLIGCFLSNQIVKEISIKMHTTIKITNQIEIMFVTSPAFVASAISLGKNGSWR